MGKRTFRSLQRYSKAYYQGVKEIFLNPKDSYETDTCPRNIFLKQRVSFLKIKRILKNAVVR